MATRSFISRLKAVEQAKGIGAEPMPKIFLGIADLSESDTDRLGSAAVEYSERTVIGARVGHIAGLAIPRLPGEDIERFKQRVAELVPDEIVFLLLYRNCPRSRGIAWGLKP